MALRYPAGRCAAPVHPATRPGYAQGVRFVRFWLPLGITALGIGMIIAGFIADEINWIEPGCVMTGAGLSVWLLNYLYLVSVRGERERDDEQAARDYFAAHGRWPDEPDR
jgi:hypothetical protein